MRDELVVADAGGALWRVDPRSTAAEIRFTRQVPGSIPEPSDPAAFLALLDLPAPAEVARMLTALQSPEGAELVAGGADTRGAQRAAAALQHAGRRGTSLRLVAGPRRRTEGNAEVLVDVVEADGSPTARFTLELVQERGTWRFSRWPRL